MKLITDCFKQFHRELFLLLTLRLLQIYLMKIVYNIYYYADKGKDLLLGGIQHKNDHFTDLWKWKVMEMESNGKSNKSPPVFQLYI